MGSVFPVKGILLGGWSHLQLLATRHLLSAVMVALELGPSLCFPPLAQLGEHQALRSVMRLRLVSVVETRSLTRWQCSPSPLGHYGSVSTTYLGRAEAQLFVFLTFQGFQVIPRYQVAGLDWQGVQPLFQQFSALVMEASIRRRSPIQIYDDENHVMSLRGGRVRVHAKTGVAPSPQGSPSKRCSEPLYTQLKARLEVVVAKAPDGQLDDLRSTPAAVLSTGLVSLKLGHEFGKCLKEVHKITKAFALLVTEAVEGSKVKLTTFRISIPEVLVT
ncbi:unnamed protein product, partial [Symbiodinium microadriaticum]